MRLVLARDNFNRRTVVMVRPWKAGNYLRNR